MKEVSRGQALQVSGRVAMQVKWEELDGERLQQEVINLTPEEFGRRFTFFLNNGCRVIIGNSKSILVKQPFSPAEFIGKGWTMWKGPADGDGLSGEEDIDPRSLVLAEVELSKFLFKTCHKAGEKLIIGEEKLRRLKKMELIRFGGAVFYALWIDYQANKENSALEWLHRNFGVTLMDFMGQVLRDPDGDRCILYLSRSDDGEWDWRYSWLGGRWDVSESSVVCAS